MAPVALSGCAHEKPRTSKRGEPDTAVGFSRMSLIPAAWAPTLLSILRIVAALSFMTHGTQKLFGMPATDPRPPVALFSQMGLAGVLETIGGALMVLGLFTQPVAFVLSGEMAVAYFRAHWPRSFWPVLNGGEPALLFCFLFLYIAAAGGGRWSLDAMLGRKRR
jgi:putative oxidoreductase